MKKILLLVILGLAFSSCEKILFEGDPEDDPGSVFTYLWKECDTKYAFFGYKGIDWNSVYTKYSSRIRSDMSDDSLFRVLWEMLNELRDGHVNLVSPFNVSRYDFDKLGPKNFDFRLIEESYLGTDYYITGPFSHDFIAGGEIGYIRYNSFSRNFSSNDLNFTLSRYLHTTGIILDLRDNGGGYVSNILLLLNRFAGKKIHIYDSYLKSGEDHEAFGEPLHVYAEPEGAVDYTGTVIVLTDRGTFSAASFFALATKSIDNMILVGDTTGGGLGLPNGGQLPNGWTYRFSITRTLTPGGLNFEDGVPPDITVMLDKELALLGIDTILEKAIDVINSR